jgi:hypothetical protein
VDSNLLGDLLGSEMAVTLYDRERPEGSPLLLWAGVLLGPIAWALDEGLSYSLAQHACSTGHEYVMYVITALSLLLAVGGALIARAQLSKVGAGNDDGAGPHHRSWWMARLGIAMGLGFSLVIVAMAVPKILLSPCD